MISPTAVAKWIARPLRDLNRVKKIPIPRVRWLLSEKGFDSEAELKPFPQQWRAILCGVMLKYFLVLLPVGTGKARIGLELIKFRVEQKHIKKALFVTLSDQSCGDVVDEAKEFTPSLRVVHLSGTTIERWEARTLDADAYVISYPGLRNMIFRAGSKYDTDTKGKRGRSMSAIQTESVRRLMEGVDMLVADELHEVHKRKTDGYQALLRISQFAKFRVGMTATAPGKTPEGLWPQFFLIDGGESLGATEGLFRAAFFSMKFNPWLGIRNYTFLQRKLPELRRMCSNRALMYEDDEIKGMPTRAYARVYVNPSVGQMKVHSAVKLELVQGKINGLLKDPNFMRLRMIASGFATYNTEDNEKVEIRFESSPKLDEVVKRFRTEKSGEKIIIVHEFRYSGKLIEDRLRKERIGYVRTFGDTKVSKRRAAKVKFEKDPKCRVLLMNWRVGGTALSFSSCRRMYIYESPLSPRAREQLEGRIRRGNSIHPVSEYVDFVTTGTVEESILGFIKTGADLRKGLLKGKAAGKQLELFA